MTIVDTIGAIITLVVFVLLAGAYFYAFRPKNKQKFEALRNFVNDEDQNEDKDSNENKDSNEDNR